MSKGKFPVGNAVPGVPQYSLAKPSHPGEMGPAADYHRHCEAVRPHPRVASLALRAIHLLAIRPPLRRIAPPGPDGAGKMRIATPYGLAMTEVVVTWSRFAGSAVVVMVHTAERS